MYIGQKMSERALEAYDRGERPRSKWSKDDLLKSLSVNVREKSKKLTLEELRSVLLEKSSWHHTGKYFNKTVFYSINEDVTDIDVDYLISIREKKEKVKTPNLYITAKVSFSVWKGTRKHPKRIDVEEIVCFRSSDKMVNTSYGNKRLTSVEILKILDQKEEN